MHDILEKLSAFLKVISRELPPLRKTLESTGNKMSFSKQTRASSEPLEAFCWRPGKGPTLFQEGFGGLMELSGRFCSPHPISPNMGFSERILALGTDGNLAENVKGKHKANYPSH